MELMISKSMIQLSPSSSSILSPSNFFSPIPSDQADPSDSTLCTSSFSVVSCTSEICLHDLEGVVQANEKQSHTSPALSPITSVVPHKATAPLSSADVGIHIPKPEDFPSSFSRNLGWEKGPNGTSPPSLLRRLKRMDELINLGEIVLKICKILFSLISFCVMAADRTQGWAGDSFERYKEYRFCLSVNVIACVVSIIQTYDKGYSILTGKRFLRHSLTNHFDFFMNQILAYLLISASSSAAVTVDDWQSNWGKDKFTVMASASISLSFLAFIAFAADSLLSGYKLLNYRKSGL